MIGRASRRVVGTVVWPPSRILAAVLLWSHRHTISLWARSLQDEIANHSIEPSRLRLLVGALWRVSSDPRFRNDPTVRRISIDGPPQEIDRGVRAVALRATLADLPGVVAVEVDTSDGPDASLGASVAVPA